MEMMMPKMNFTIPNMTSPTMQRAIYPNQATKVMRVEPTAESNLSTMAALQFFLLSLHDQKDAWARYLRLVRRAGTASYTELCETAGLQVPFNDGSIKAIAQQMSQWIAEHQV